MWELEDHTWVHLQGLVPVQAEQAGASDCAEDLPGGKVHPIIDLEVESTGQRACIQHKNNINVFLCLIQPQLSSV